MLVLIFILCNCSSVCFLLYTSAINGCEQKSLFINIRNTYCDFLAIIKH